MPDWGGKFSFHLDIRMENDKDRLLHFHQTY